MTPNPVDGQWLDFYALLDVPVGAEEDTIRKRIGKVYSEAAANSDHRDLARRHYFQALVERVLPQCRRVLLDPEWRAKYDRQHILNANSDPSAQNYVAFIASMRGKDTVVTGDEVLPQRLQEDINIAREVVECAWQGTQLELLPTKAVSVRNAPDASSPTGAPLKTAQPAFETRTRRLPADSNAPTAEKVAHGVTFGVPAPIAVPIAPPAPPSPHRSDVSEQRLTPRQLSKPQQTPATPLAPQPVAPQQVAPQASMLQQVAPQPRTTNAVAPEMALTPAPTPIIEEIKQEGEAVRAKVITSQEAAEIRRRRASNPDGEEFSSTNLGDGPRSKKRKQPNSRFSVGDVAQISAGRLISPTSMNLMVAIVGVLLTITIQRFASTPAIANNVGRTPIFVAVAPEMEGALLRAETSWEKTPEGANFDLVVQNVGSRAGLSRALGMGGATPDVWIPSDASWVELYNQKAPKLKREAIVGDEFIAQSPMVLLARSERAGELRRTFPNHQIPSWSALRGAIARGAAGHLGLADPQKTESGALSRFSMAREWGAERGLAPGAVAKRGDFWKWMAGFEDNAPSAAARTGDMVKDMAQGTTGRFWWVVAYESDALRWMNAGKKLEIYYLPRTTYANHPFCPLNRVGASDGVVQGRASFQKFLRSETMQKQLLNDGFRPTEVSLKLKTGSNPFLNPEFRARGARIEGLPLEERSNATATETIAQQWGKRYG